MQDMIDTDVNSLCNSNDTHLKLFTQNIHFSRLPPAFSTSHYLLGSLVSPFEVLWYLIDIYFSLFQKRSCYCTTHLMWKLSPSIELKLANLSGLHKHINFYLPPLPDKINHWYAHRSTNNKKRYAHRNKRCSIKRFHVKNISCLLLVICWYFTA